MYYVKLFLTSKSLEELFKNNFLISIQRLILIAMYITATSIFECYNIAYLIFNISPAEYTFSLVVYYIAICAQFILRGYFSILLAYLLRFFYNQRNQGNGQRNPFINCFVVSFFMIYMIEFVLKNISLFLLQISYIESNL